MGIQGKVMRNYAPVPTTFNVHRQGIINIHTTLLLAIILYYSFLNTKLGFIYNTLLSCM